jgi:predicted phosphodiesterase
MLIQFASDLHLDHIYRDRRLKYSNTPVETGVASQEETGASVLVLAGDLANNADAIDYFRDYKIPVIVILGNHEHYGNIAQDVIEKNRNDSKGSSVHFLENDSIVIDGVRFIGSTLWTDCDVGPGDLNRKKLVIERSMNDYRLIRSRAMDGKVSTLTAEESIRWHSESVDYIDGMLNLKHDGPTVVVTHHLPSESCVSPKFKGSSINGGFASDLDAILAGNRADLWIHGHTHDNVDTLINGTRVVCNPRGYPLRGLLKSGAGFDGITFENVSFNPAMVVEVPNKILNK